MCEQRDICLAFLLATPGREAFQARTACDIWWPVWGQEEYCQKSQI